MNDIVDDSVSERSAKLYILFCLLIHPLHWSSSRCSGRWKNCPFAVRKNPY